MRFLVLCLVFMLLLSSSFAGFVYGEIYQSNLEELNNTLIKIEGSFSYQIVVHNANYSVFLPEGDYTISASYFDEQGNLILYTEEIVKVGKEDQKVDLVLKPTSSVDYYLISIILAVTAIIIILLKLKGKSVPEPPTRKKSLDSDAKKVLQALDSFEGRATQKELKQTLNFSDAKLSLIITELEELEYIKKFKRGRGNIIRKIQ